MRRDPTSSTSTHCDPIEPDCVFDPTSWDDEPGVDGPVLRCQTHGLLATSEVYEQIFVEEGER